MKKPSAHYEVVPAKKYYGPHAIGYVVLRNGYPEYHGKKKNVNLILRGFKHECQAA